MNDSAQTAELSPGHQINIRRAVAPDVRQVVAIDARVTGNGKPDYWQDIYERYATRRLDERFFLVAEAGADQHVVGYMIGEVRIWEFGSEPCGWIFAFAVDPDSRLQGIGEKLFKEISDEFQNIGLKTMRTMVLRQDQLPMGFFRSEGMVAGPYIQLEKELDE